MRHADVALRPGGDRARRRRDRRRARRASTRSPAAGARRPSADVGAHRRPAPPRRSLPLRASRRSGRAATVLEVDGTRIEAERRARLPRTSAASTYGGALVPHADARCRTPTCWSRSTACRTASRATTAASCAASRPRVVVVDPRRRPATRSHAGDVVAVVESMKMETLADRARPRPRARGARVGEHARPGGQSRWCRSSRSRTDGCRRGDRLGFASPADPATRPPDAPWRAAAARAPGVGRARLRRAAEGGAGDSRRCPGGAGRPRRRVAPAGGLRRPSRGQPPARRRERCRRRRAQPAALPAGVPAVARPELRGAARPVRGKSGARAAPLRHRWSGAHGRARGRQLPAVLVASARGHRAARSVRGILERRLDRRRRPGRVRRRVPRGAGPARGGARHPRARAGRAGPRGALASVRPPADRAGRARRTTRSSTSTSTRWPRIRPAPIARRMREHSSSARSRWRRWCSAESATPGPSCARSCSRR